LIQLCYFFAVTTAPLDYIRPELFDEAVDRHHRSYVSAVLEHSLGTIRCRTTRTLMPMHQRWIPKYVIHIFFIYFCFFTIVIALGKLIFFQITRCRTSACCVVGRGGQATSWGSPGGAVDAVLLRRPADPRVHGPVATKDTHTFHFSVGEMTLSLEDGAMLGGLPCAGQAMGPIDIPMTWHTDFLARFTNVPRNDSASAPFVPFADTHGPTWTWIQQFRTWF
jgi:hypothetical protein